MESSLVEAEAARDRLVARVQAPRWFFAALGAAVALQIASAAFGIGDERPWVLVGGLVAFAGVAAVLLGLLRRRTGVWLGGLASRVVLGTDAAAATAYTLALAAAIWAALDGPGALVVACAVAGGAGYAVAGQRWVRGYRAAPEAHAAGESALVLVLGGAAAVGGLVLLLAGA